jgi:hypothetical protein
MGAISRRKGAGAEVDVVNYLREHGYPDARRYLAGDGRQPGDIDAIPAVSIEVKNQKELALSSWLDQAVAEARSNLPVVVAKRRGRTDVGDWYTVMRFEDFLGLVADEQPAAAR